MVALLQKVGFVAFIVPMAQLLFVLADDFGWNNWQYRNPDLISPTLDQLALTPKRLLGAIVTTPPPSPPCCL